MITLRQNIRLIAAGMLTLFFLSLGGVTHAHDLDHGTYVHRHAPMTAGDDAHARDHEENTIAIYNEGVALQLASTAKYTAFQSVNDRGSDYDSGNVYRAVSDIQPPGNSRGYMPGAAHRAVKDRFLLLTGARRAPPSTR